MDERLCVTKKRLGATCCGADEVSRGLLTDSDEFPIMAIFRVPCAMGGVSVRYRIHNFYDRGQAAPPGPLDQESAWNLLHPARIDSAAQ
jgi:hypothetical protein